MGLLDWYCEVCLGAIYGNRNIITWNCYILDRPKYPQSLTKKLK